MQHWTPEVYLPNVIHTKVTDNRRTMLQKNV